MYVNNEQFYQLMSPTYRICFISLPIPVTGPEGPSKFLVLSLELAFYEISVALQKHVEVKSDSMMCGILCRNDVMNVLVDSW